MSNPTLVGLSYSPWTHRAQWALDHHGIGYDFEHYLPVVGEPWLRLRARKLSGKVSVPTLLTPHGAITDSIDIAKHADSRGNGEKLYDGHEQAVARWLGVSEPALHAARSLVLRAVEANPLAQQESVSLPLPNALKGPTAKFGTFMLRQKWQAALSDSEAEAALVRGLDALRKGLAGKDYLDGSFSLADIVMSGVVQTIKPVSDDYVRLRPGTRQSWTRDDLAARYSDLVEWRDKLYAKHRQRRNT